jgi:hypothetical protein
LAFSNVEEHKIAYFPIFNMGSHPINSSITSPIHLELPEERLIIDPEMVVSPEDLEDRI